MARIISGFCVPHNPLMASTPKIDRQHLADSVFAGMEVVHQRLLEQDIDTVIVIGDDHYTKFGPHCLPQYLIATGDLAGPEEPWLNIEHYQVPNHEKLACHIRDYGFDHGFDWASATSLELEHGTMLPIHLSVKPQESGIRTIPIYIASGVVPLLRIRRAHDLGRMIGDAVVAWSGDERVAVIGSGGLSHWVGMAQMGQINSEFDQMFLEYVASGNTEAIMDLSDDYILEQAGNGAFEVRNWVCAMGAVQATGANHICYEAVNEWVAGCACTELTFESRH